MRWDWDAAALGCVVGFGVSGLIVYTTARVLANRDRSTGEAAERFNVSEDARWCCGRRFATYRELARHQADKGMVR